MDSYSFKEFKDYLIACDLLFSEDETIISALPIYKNNSSPEAGIRYFSVRAATIPINDKVYPRLLKVKPAAIKAWKLANVG